MPPEYSAQEKWFAAHLQPHEAMLRSWLSSRFPKHIDIDDIIQEAFVRVLRAHEQGPVNTPKAFLFATARNFALNAVRSSAVRGRYERLDFDDCEIIDSQLGVAETMVRVQELEMLTKAIQSLPDRCRQIFTLRKVYGMPQREIAKKLGLSTRTVNAQISIGINKCLEFVASQNNGSAS
jgi:RNA polymerase sigma factor (sigma-70 family)